MRCFVQLKHQQKEKQVDRFWCILAIIEERLKEPQTVCVRPLRSEECIEYVVPPEE